MPTIDNSMLEKSAAITFNIVKADYFRITTHYLYYYSYLVDCHLHRHHLGQKRVSLFQDYPGQGLLKSHPSFCSFFLF